MSVSFSSIRRRRPSGFTLVEVLVSSVLIVGIMALLLGTVDQTQRLWMRSRSKTTQFQAARAAFEAMSRRLSQATLNTYWKAHEATVTSATADFKFRRQADLQFVSGPTSRFFMAGTQVANLNTPVPENYPGHAMFFAAPLGYTEYPDATIATQKEFRSLDSALSACGYFIEFADDPSVPSFLTDMKPPFPPRYRYRLMEMTVPAEKFNIYQRVVDDGWDIDPRIFDEKASSGNPSYYGGMVNASREPIQNFVRPFWMKEAFTRKTYGSANPPVYRFQYARPMAENIVALIVLPKLAVKDRLKKGVADPDSLELAPKYEYDSWRVLSGSTEPDPIKTHTNVKLDNRARDNLLPPIVQLTMVAIDEPSVLRMDLQMTGKPDWTKNLFKDATTETKHLENVTTMEKAIRDDPNYRQINYRIFTSDVIIRGSKWSRDPKN